MTKSSRFWWTVRRWWHYPQMVAMCAYESFMPLSLLRVRAYRGWWFRNNWTALKQQTVRLLAKIWSHGPLACNGDSPTFRYTVDFCEWLEMKARNAERKEGYDEDET